MNAPQKPVGPPNRILREGEQPRIMELRGVADDEHLPADRAAYSTWCLKCGRAIESVYKEGWRLRYPNAGCSGQKE